MEVHQTGLLHPRKTSGPFDQRQIQSCCKKAGLYDLIPKKVWKKDWVCDVKAVGNGEAVLKYLAPYVYRVAISDRNIMNVRNDRVTFR